MKISFDVHTIPQLLDDQMQDDLVGALVEGLKFITRTGCPFKADNSKTLGEYANWTLTIEP